jgi:calcineurin-like phosphoesterase family protein
MTIHFTADLHFGHRLMALQRAERLEYDHDTDAEAIEQHDAELVRRWNQAVLPRDEVWVLGDFSFMSARRTQGIFQALRGELHFVRGNHDPNSLSSLDWSSVHELTSRRFDGQHVVMCHYPLSAWQSQEAGAWQLHGHSHCKGIELPGQMDVGIDCHPELRPFTLDEIQAHLQGDPR